MRGERYLMEHKPYTSYPPLPYAPLRMRGVFGVTWQLYKRGFWQMFVFTLSIVGTGLAILMLSTFQMLKKTGALDEIRSGLNEIRNLSAFGTNSHAQALAIVGFICVLILIALLYVFLIAPAYRGAVYLEMDQRMAGRCGTLYQLFRYALPLGLKRFYTTFLVLWLARLVVNAALNIMTDMAYPLLMVSVAGLVNNPYAHLTGLIWTGATICIIAFVIGVIYELYLLLVYPAATHEGKRAFDALFRGVKLSARRFGRLFSSLLLIKLILFIASLAVMALPMLLLWDNAGAMLITVFVVLVLWATLTTPYIAALATALYADSATRADMQIRPIPPSQPDAPGTGTYSPQRPQAYPANDEGNQN